MRRERITLVLRIAVLASIGAASARADREYASTVRSVDDAEVLTDDRSTSSVKKADLDRRLPRSTPDALRFEPGLFVQQSAHGQASVIIRGFTGQQTIMLFDGIRLNNSTYRQGPNQYFFTVDVQTLQAIESQRGGASTRWGGDALGGVLDAVPLEPTVGGDRPTARAKLRVFHATADRTTGGRLQLELAGTGKRGVAVGFLGGVGGRDVGLLTGPPVQNPTRGSSAGVLPWVPRYKEYVYGVPFDQQPALRTQLGTGYKELTGDARLVVLFPGEQRLTLAAYFYREFDAPRTDQCPPPTALTTQCLTYEQQFRTMVYGAWAGRLGRWADSARVTVSWQEQHEQRRLDLTAANRVDRGYDTVQVWGVTAAARIERLQLAPWLGLRAEYGADSYFDWLRSRAEKSYTDAPTVGVRDDTRGQYLDKGTYLSGGAFADLAAEIGDRLVLRGGARLGWVAAHAAGEATSNSQPVNKAWAPLVGHAGIEVRVADPVRLYLNYDNSYRAPNLDDMTARLQTGPGFQFENAALQPEHAHTVELGARVRHPWVALDAWLFETVMEAEIIRVSRVTEDCPPATPQCQGSWARFQLQNSPSYSERRGAEGSVKVFFPHRLSLRAVASYVWGEGPRVGVVAKGEQPVVLTERVPLSKIPPLHGSVELEWSHRSGFSAGAALQWADAQDRLSYSDRSDGRIPKYGTPGYAVVSLRAAYRLPGKAMLSAVLGNLFDSPWRVHGSSVNGAGRELLVQMEVSPTFL